jgi:hypothetical protein
MAEQQFDPVNKPKHYNSHPSGIEVINITRYMSFDLGNATKYIMRCDLKSDAIEDLKKAIWYINDALFYFPKYSDNKRFRFTDPDYDTMRPSMIQVPTITGCMTPNLANALDIILRHEFDLPTIFKLQDAIDSINKEIKAREQSSGK